MTQTIEITDIKANYVQVKNSGIHRNGVFAKTDIPKNTTIMEYKGMKITKEEGNMIIDQTFEKFRDDPENNAATYVFELDDKYDLDGDIPDNDAKYINHSCDPNCEFVVKGERVWIVTLRDIKSGEEILYNYGFGINEKDPYDFKQHICKCGSSKCIGYILSEDEWPKIKELLEKENLIEKNI
jgi:hypothetical protein